MKKLFFPILLVLAIFSLPYTASAVVTDNAFGVLARTVNDHETIIGEHEEDLNSIRDILKGMSASIQALQGKGVAPRSQGPVIINDKDNQARRIGNRALAWAIKSQILCSVGNSPDIEDIEKMLSPIVAGNMEPKRFEDALAAALKKRGWRVVNPSTPLCPDQIKKICNDAIAETLKELTDKVSKLETELKEVRKIAEDAQKSAEEANKTAGKAVDTAVTASETATKALTTANGIEIPTVDMSAVKAEAKATAEATATALIPDTKGFATKADLDVATTCLEKKINVAKADAEATNQALTRAFNTNDKNKARAELYASLMERYQRRGYKGDSVHGMVQLYLRACYWSEELIEKTAKASGGKLVDVNQITPPADPPAK